MSEDRLPLADLLAKARDNDFLRSAAEAVLPSLMETGVEGPIGAGRHEQAACMRLPQRPDAGYAPRCPATTQPQAPPFLEPRKTSEKAQVAAIQEV